MFFGKFSTAMFDDSGIQRRRGHAKRSDLSSDSSPHRCSRCYHPTFGLSHGHWKSSLPMGSRKNQEPTHKNVRFLSSHCLVSAIGYVSNFLPNEMGWSLKYAQWPSFWVHSLSSINDGTFHGHDLQGNPSKSHQGTSARPLATLRCHMRWLQNCSWSHQADSAGGSSLLSWTIRFLWKMTVSRGDNQEKESYWDNQQQQVCWIYIYIYKYYRYSFVIILRGKIPFHPLIDNQFCYSNSHLTGPTFRQTQ